MPRVDSRPAPADHGPPATVRFNTVRPDGSLVTDDPARRRDALLTVAVLVPLAATAVAVDAPLAPLPVAAGALGTLAVEVVLVRFRDRVRRLWARRTVRVGSVALALGAGLVAALFGPWLLTAAVAGLLTYLALLGVVAGTGGREAGGGRSA